MAHISESKYWPTEGDHYQYLITLIFSISALLILLLLTFLTWEIIQLACIFRRFLSIKFGKRIEPNGKRAILITGATSGIGLLLAKHFYRLGFTVFAGYYNNQEAGYGELMDLGQRAYEEVRSKRNKSPNDTDYGHQPGLYLIQMDVRSLESIENSGRQIEALLDEHKLELHCLINNAGISTAGSFEIASSKSIRDTVETNLIGVMSVTKQFILRIIKSKGRVVNVSSGVDKFPGPGLSSYGSTKSAVSYFTAALNEDLQGYGVPSLCVVPGNFIVSSNIIFARMRGFQESVDRLSEDEKLVYRHSIELNRLYLTNLLRERLMLTDEDPNELAKVYKFRLPEEELAEIKRPSRDYHPLTWIFRQMDGSSAGKSLEDSGLVRAYEDAVRLCHPPSRLYAGDTLFTYLWGPRIDYIPPVISSYMATFMSRNLYRISTNQKQS